MGSRVCVLLKRNGGLMSVAIGPVFLVLASVLLGAVIMFTIFGLIVLVRGRHRTIFGAPRDTRWQSSPAYLSREDGASSIAGSGK